MGKRLIAPLGMLAPMPKLTIEIGSPHGEGQDEDSLNRERDGNGDDDIATEAICSIVRNLHQGGPSAVRDLRKFTSALEDMCQAFMDRDRKGFEDAASDARDALEGLIGG
jgi:hypothetical protein